MHINAMLVFAVLLRNRSSLPAWSDLWLSLHFKEYQQKFLGHSRNATNPCKACLESKMLPFRWMVLGLLRNTLSDAIPAPIPYPFLFALWSKYAEKNQNPESGVTLTNNQGRRELFQRAQKSTKLVLKLVSNWPSKCLQTIYFTLWFLGWVTPGPRVRVFMCGGLQDCLAQMPRRPLPPSPGSSWGLTGWINADLAGPR